MNGEAFVESQNQTQSDDRDVRCLCGQLIARRTDNGVEIKCKRCRRVILILFKTIAGNTSPRLP